MRVHSAAFYIFVSCNSLLCMIIIPSSRSRYHCEIEYSSLFVFFCEEGFLALQSSPVNFFVQLSLDLLKSQSSILCRDAREHQCCYAYN